VDSLQREELAIVTHSQRHGAARGTVFDAVREHAARAAGAAPATRRHATLEPAGPRLSEPWFC
jgi:hypothetical protein